MTRPPLHIPAFVSYACQCCGWCCHQYDITFSAAEHRRLSALDWGRLEPALAGTDWCAPLRDRRSPDTYRLRYSAAGACVFLTEGNLCRMHSHVGELGKPLGCCVFPFTFADTPCGVYVGCRFSCLAMARGEGEPIERRRDFLTRQLRLVEESGHLPHYNDPVLFAGYRTLPWEDYLALEEMLIRILLRDDAPLVRRLFALFKVIEVLRMTRLAKVRGRRFRELVALLETGLMQEATDEPLPERPNFMQQMLFRQFCFLFQRHVGGSYRELDWKGRLAARLRNVSRAIRFTFNAGSAHLPDFPGPVNLARVLRVAPPPLGPAEETALSRYLAAKLFGKQHFGKLFFGYPLADGLTFLLLSAGAVLWYARAHAQARGADTADSDDLVSAIRYVDFCYGFSAAPGLIIERLRTKMLGHGNASVRLALAPFR